MSIEQQKKHKKQHVSEQEEEDWNKDRGFVSSDVGMCWGFSGCSENFAVKWSGY